VQRLGELSGKPSTSKLHIHPVSNSGRELGGKDDEISVISSEQAKKIYKDRLLFQTEKKQSGKEGWHSDITFEPVPSDYALLRLTQLPKTGGGKSTFQNIIYDVLMQDRYPLGIWLRSVRPNFSSRPKISRGLDRHLRTT
jgi:alpha-ketoglutarate-dependent taurine dioxygenase